MTIDDDVAREISKLAGNERGSFRAVVNDLLRRGLSSGSRPAAKRAKFVVKPQHCGFRPGVDPLKLNALYDELETEQFIERHSAPKRTS